MTNPRRTKSAVNEMLDAALAEAKKAAATTGMSALYAATADHSPYVVTASGGRMDLLAPLASAVHWPDITHALARINRFSGATRTAYSVAEHSCMLFDQIELEKGPGDAKVWALLHDAHEAYVGDMTSPVSVAIALLAKELAVVKFVKISDPIKQKTSNIVTEAINASLPSLVMKVIKASVEGMKHGLDHAIYEAAGYPPPCAMSPDKAAVLKTIDRAMALHERALLIPSEAKGIWNDNPMAAKVSEKMGVTPTGWSAERAEAEYIARLRQIGVAA